jgi:hypothetical protein
MRKRRGRKKRIKQNGENTNKMEEKSFDHLNKLAKGPGGVN